MVPAAKVPASIEAVKYPVPPAPVAGQVEPDAQVVGMPSLHWTQAVAP
jgi:hypothetical protein